MIYLNAIVTNKPAVILRQCSVASTTLMKFSYEANKNLIIIVTMFPRTFTPSQSSYHLKIYEKGSGLLQHITE